MDEHPDRDERDRPDPPDDEHVDEYDGPDDESDGPDDGYDESDAEYDENDAYAEYDEYDDQNDPEYDNDDVDGLSGADEPYDEYEPDPDQHRSDDAVGPRIRPGLAFVLGALVGLLALGGIWAYASLTGTSDARAGTPAGAAGTAATVLGTQQTQAAEAGREATCRKAWHAQAPALRAAASTLDQWEVHVGAMNKLVVGAITMQQANAFWNQTRVGASQRLVRYLAADQQAMDAVANCSQAVGAPSSATLHECARAVKARARTLHAAQVAVSTWKHHVRDMEMLRMGHLTPAQANKMWLESWHKGMKQLHAYRAAANASSGLAC